VTFQCTEGKSYHLIMQDSLSGAIDNVRGYMHWAKFNLECNASTLTGTTVGNGIDMTQSYAAVGYLPPAFPFIEFNHFHFVLFETDSDLGATKLADFNAYMIAKNVVTGGAPTIPLHMKKLGLTSLPVARSWIDVTTSFFSKVRIDRILPPGVVLEGFSDVQCKCNTYGNEADTQCVDRPLLPKMPLSPEDKKRKKCWNLKSWKDRCLCHRRHRSLRRLRRRARNGEKDVTKQRGPCDVNCVKAAAAFQGADALIASDDLKYWMDVKYKASETAGEACGMHRSFAAVSPFFVNPSAPTKVTTAETREEPVVTFQCTEGKSYHLIMQDSLFGAIDNVRGYTHWAKFNLECNASTSTGTTVGNGIDMTQSSSGAIGYLPPAFPFSEFHHFHFVLFETDDAFGATKLADFNAYMIAENMLTGGAPTIPLHMEQLGLKHLPVARSWIDVTTSFFSKVRIDRILPPGVVLEGFSDVQCKCNTYGNEADAQCVLPSARRVRSEDEIQKKCSSEMRMSDRRACLLRWGIF